MNSVGLGLVVNRQLSDLGREYFSCLFRGGHWVFSPLAVFVRILVMEDLFILIYRFLYAQQVIR